MAVEQPSEEVTLAERAIVPVLSIRGTIPVEQLGEVVGERAGALYDYLQRSGARPAGPPYVRYYSFGDVETDFEFGVPVVEPFPGEGRIAAGALPGGEAISTWHSGAHRQLGEAYGRIFGWLEQHHREAASPLWEVYHWIDLNQPIDTSNWGDPPGWHTQLVQPIK